jgi:hypothetical protein
MVTRVTIEERNVINLLTGIALDELSRAMLDDDDDDEDDDEDCDDASSELRVGLCCLRAPWSSISRSSSSISLLIKTQTNHTVRSTASSKYHISFNITTVYPYAMSMISSPASRVTGRGCARAARSSLGAIKNMCQIKDSQYIDTYR